MYKLLSVFIGFLISVMILVNGKLAASTGNIGSAVIIHTTGIVAVFALLFIKKKTLKWPKGLPWYYLSGGAIGVLTIWSNNLAFSALGVSLTLALGLLGQTAAALLIDHFGLFGTKAQPLTFNRLVVLALIGSGIYAMTLS